MNVYKKLVLLATALMPTWVFAQAVQINYVDEFKVFVFVFLTGLIFAVIPAALMTGFKLGLKYNVFLGVILCGLTWGLTSYNHAYTHTSINICCAFFIGWALSNLLLYKYVLVHMKKPD